MTEARNELSKVPGQSVDLIAQNIEHLKQLFPEAITDGKIDFNKLKVVLGTAVEDSIEKYQFTWPGKNASIRLAQRPSLNTLLPKQEKSENWSETKNLYIEGDNLEALKVLQKSYAGKVKFIYIDPPYNTGHDFVYKDDFSDEKSHYLDVTGQEDEQGQRLMTNSETSGRFHSNWLSMMYPRLRLARNMLSNDGVIAMSIDDGELENLRKISKEIFGETNFLGQITYLNNPKGRSQDKYLATSSEYILLFSKATLKPGSISIKKNRDTINKQYPFEDDNGKFRLIELRNTHREFGKFNRPNLYYPIFVNKNGEVQDSEGESSTAVFPIWNDGFEGCWTWGIEKFRSEIRVLVAKQQHGSWKIYRKDYAKLDGGTLTKVQTLLTDKKFHTEKGQSTLNRLFDSADKIFQSPKSVALVQLLVEMATNKDSLVLDFFSGSGTTAQAVMQQNVEDGGCRRFIMVQIPEETPVDSIANKNGYKTITDIGEERIRRAGSLLPKKESRQNLDTGFRVYQVASSNINRWSDMSSSKQDILLLEENFKPDRSTDDVMTEILLKEGFDLSSSVQSLKIGRSTVYVVSGGSLFIALGERTITSTVANKIADLHRKSGIERSTVVFQDNGFVGDSEKLNSIEILNDSGFQYADIQSI